MKITVQDLIDWLRDGEQLAARYRPGSYASDGRDAGIVPWDDRAVRIEGKYNLAAVVQRINERIEDGQS